MQLEPIGTAPNGFNRRESFSIRGENVCEDLSHVDSSEAAQVSIGFVPKAVAFRVLTSSEPDRDGETRVSKTDSLHAIGEAHAEEITYVPSTSSFDSLVQTLKLTNGE